MRTHLDDRMQEEDAERVAPVRRQLDVALRVHAQILLRAEVPQPQLLVPPQHVSCTESTGSIFEAVRNSLCWRSIWSSVRK